MLKAHPFFSSGLFINAISVLIIALSFFIGFPSARVIWNAQSSQDWPTVPGNVMSSVVERFWISRNNEDVTQLFRPRIWFSYQVDGTSYVADSWMLAQPWIRNHKQALETVEKYKAGTTVNVYYRPGDPSFSVLETGRVAAQDCIRLGLACLLGVFAVISLASTRVGEKKPDEG